MSEKKEVTSLEVIGMIKDLLNTGIFQGAKSEQVTVAKQFIDHSLKNMQEKDGKKEESK